MPQIDVKPFYSIGVPEIDAQHKSLVDMIGRLAGSLHSGPVNKEIGRVLIDLANYTQTHFSDEEKLMLSIGFHGYAAHKSQHEDFVRRLTLILDNLKRGQKIDVFNLMDFLKNWLMEHISKEDIKIGQAMAAHRPVSKI